MLLLPPEVLSSDLLLISRQSNQVYKIASEREHIIFRKYPLYIKRVLSEVYIPSF
jgi:hypothetical protein